MEHLSLDQSSSFSHSNDDKHHCPHPYPCSQDREVSRRADPGALSSKSTFWRSLAVLDQSPTPDQPAGLEVRSLCYRK